jgi:N-6 DNA Methylase.
MISNEKINKLLGITESYQAPAVMLAIMLDTKKRKKLFDEFLEYENKMDYEWFMNYFESEHADRKTKKQDFTPMSVATTLNRLVRTRKKDEDNLYFESTAGNGGIMIKNWHETRTRTTPFSYDPRAYWHQVEELSDRAIPFLIFNMSIRGMNGVIIHGDSLERTASEVYFIRNDSGNYLGFSEVIKMEHTDLLARELDIKWL